MVKHNTPGTRQCNKTTIFMLDFQEIATNENKELAPVAALRTVCSCGSSASKRLTMREWKNPAGRSTSGVTVPVNTRLSRKVLVAVGRQAGGWGRVVAWGGQGPCQVGFNRAALALSLFGLRYVDVMLESKRSS